MRASDRWARLSWANGIDLMGDILRIADVPVIFISGYQVIAQAFEMGAADYIVKPFSPTEIDSQG